MTKTEFYHICVFSSKISSAIFSLLLACLQIWLVEVTRVTDIWSLAFDKELIRKMVSTSFQPFAVFIAYFWEKNLNDARLMRSFDGDGLVLRLITPMLTFEGR